MGIFGISKRERERELLQALHERDHWRAVALGVPGTDKGWPQEVRLTRGPKSDRLRFAPATPPPGYEAASEHLTRVYVLSAKEATR